MNDLTFQDVAELLSKHGFIYRDTDGSYYAGFQDGYDLTDVIDALTLDLRKL